ncbi:hypothetical protein G9A89_015122 [Geosiphon pyriformis]|nr:hypothetical protein G9A89_015122 [Geosiphon pyriformis]
MESFELDKSHTIRSVLEHPFWKVVLDHLVMSEELVLKPDLIKSKVDEIIEGWIRKCVVISDFSDNWAHQFQPLDYVFNGAFSGMMCVISFDKMFDVISALFNGKAAGLSVHDDLNQEKIFLPLLWRIFYDPLLCEVKRQESICDYRLNSYFISKTGQLESQARLISFLAAGAFVNNTIWIGSSQAATQHILDIANDFFRINDILINNKKTVAIFVNCQVVNPCLIISGASISITKKEKSYHYLGIFLSSEGLSRPSLVKAQLDVWFFVNLVLKKTISDKQFTYLTSAVFFPIISYRTQFSFIPVSVCNKWDALIHKDLKSRFGLLLDFFNDAPHHSFLYNLKTFKQIQPESKLASVVVFANSVGILGHLFSYRSHDLQALSWHPHYPLLFPVCVGFSPSNNFLASVACIFSGCNLSLGGSLASAFRLCGSTPMSLVLGEPNFVRCVSLLRHYGITFVEQLCDKNGLLNVDAVYLSVYMDGSLGGLSTVNMKTRAAVFFGDISLGLGVDMTGLVSFTLAELQAIALALECVPLFCLVDLFSDSQVALDACRSKSLLFCLDFRNRCWIEHYHISYSDVLGNECADALAKKAAFSAWHLPYMVDEHFLKAGGTAVSGNSRHFWEMGFGAQAVDYSLHANIDWSRSSLTAGFRTYFMKAIHRRLSVTVYKWLYNRCYPSVICLFCGDVEISDHTFFCPFNASDCVYLLESYASAWKSRSGLFQSASCVSQLLSTCASDVLVVSALYKSFVFKNWYCESALVSEDAKVAASNIVEFVCKFCLAFKNNIWLVRAKHQALWREMG